MTDTCFDPPTYPVQSKKPEEERSSTAVFLQNGGELTGSVEPQPGDHILSQMPKK